MPRFVRAGFLTVAFEVEVLRAAPAFGRPTFGFSLIKLARVAVAAAALAGDPPLIGGIGFSGDAGRDKKDF